MHVKSRPAAVGDKLVTKRMGSTSGFADPAGTTNEQLIYGEGEPVLREVSCDLAVCLLPGTEVAFDAPIQTRPYVYGDSNDTNQLEHSVGRFKQVRKDEPNVHHDALELPNGDLVMLNDLAEGQRVTVLQLPAAPKTIEEAKEQTRLEVVG
jgi:hypothetical protein